MNEHNPNLSAVDLVAKSLGELAQELTVVGGCAAGMLITDKGSPPVRQTADVDLVAQVASVADYYTSLHPRLRACGFIESPNAEHVCRWRKGSLILDVMPSTEIFGHSVNRWYTAAVASGSTVALPSGNRIKLVSAPLLLATKFDSFESRGAGDYLHHDMEDILNVVDGREELREEMRLAPADVRTFVRDELDGYLADPNFTDQLEWLFPGGRSNIVVARLRFLAGL